VWQKGEMLPVLQHARFEGALSGLSRSLERRLVGSQRRTIGEGDSITAAAGMAAPRAKVPGSTPTLLALGSVPRHEPCERPRE